MGKHHTAETWRDDLPTRTGRGQDPMPDTRAGLLLARLRAEPGRAMRVARDVSPWWWLRRDARPLQELVRRKLVETSTETTSAFGADVWARAVPVDGCCCDGYVLSCGGPHDPECPVHGQRRDPDLSWRRS